MAGGMGRRRWPRDGFLPLGAARLHSSQPASPSPHARGLILPSVADSAALYGVFTLGRWDAVMGPSGGWPWSKEGEGEYGAMGRAGDQLVGGRRAPAWRGAVQSSAKALEKAEDRAGAGGPRRASGKRQMGKKCKRERKRHGATGGERQPACVRRWSAVMKGRRAAARWDGAPRAHPGSPVGPANGSHTDSV